MNSFALESNEQFLFPSYLHRCQCTLCKEFSRLLTPRERNSSRRLVSAERARRVRGWFLTSLIFPSAGIKGYTMSKVHEICRHWFKHSFDFVLLFWKSGVGKAVRHQARHGFGRGGLLGQCKLRQGPKDSRRSEKRHGMMISPERREENQELV
jgi:hypothetical protein